MLEARPHQLVLEAGPGRGQRVEVMDGLEERGDYSFALDLRFRA